MATISNVSLKIDPIASNKRRKVTVSYSLRFNPREEAAGSVFEENVVLRGDDPIFDDDRAVIAASFVKAVPGTLNRSFTKQVSQNRLDEDGDTIIFGVPVLTLKDELYARVTLKPFAPRPAQADSNLVSGQFGPGA
ncbi:hypothetical protein DFR29_12718 [Tahibacter aquaticus]|uniref:Uncharacterized protein n=1 Tax=Tahibacter aquaticus TaxID=520092 RepID=A0A4R6YIE1_9GAMM|nr:hypothetical protein [Tahibacter aquaticus]TDR36668.1 hypothetical protein DFR29_12718 [Tahibacter aquaticus]